MFYNFATVQKEEVQATACVFGTKPLFSFKTKRFGFISAYSVVEELTKSNPLIENPKIPGNGYFISKDGEIIALDKRLDKEPERKIQLILINFGKNDKSYIKKYYPQYKTSHEIILGSGRKKRIVEVEIFFLKNENGDTVFGIKAPELFEETIKNIVNFIL